MLQSAAVQALLSLSPKVKAVLLALFVTLLWSSSWVLVKFGLDRLPALTFAGLRYTLAFAILLPLLFAPARLAEFRSLSRRNWGLLALLGLVYYTLTQGALFVGLNYLAANTLSLIMTLSGISIALAGRLFLGERLSGLQWSGVFVSIGGALLYFGNIPGVSNLGLLVGGLALLANTGGAVLGRAVNRTAAISPWLVTIVSMGVGSLILLAAGTVSEPFPALDVQDLLLLLWLAAANTSLAFTLWNLTLRTLTVAQSSMINNTMLIQIAVLAWIFLGEHLSWVQIAGLLVAAVGAALVQISPRRVIEAGTGS
ncbi:MAG TPA: DMT family transporter [Anaerolineales bacterium]